MIETLTEIAFMAFVVSSWMTIVSLITFLLLQAL